MDYSREINRNKKSKLQEIESMINNERLKNTDTDKIKELQMEYEHIHSQATEGAKVRSRVEFWEEGEKSTKYFYNLEKRNGK